MEIQGSLSFATYKLLVKVHLELYPPLCYNKIITYSSPFIKIKINLELHCNYNIILAVNQGTI